MTVPVPLGVRLYNNRGKAFDAWITRWVDDITFRSVVPGGFASATITLHNDPDQPFRQIAQTFTRVQICDLRSAEIAWEGRVDTARRDSAADTWELGCLGAMIVASDIQIPWFAIDGDVSNWFINGGGIETWFSPKINADAQEITMTPNNQSWSGHNSGIAEWTKAELCDMRIGRFDITYSGAAASANFRTGLDVVNSAGVRQNNVDVSGWNTAALRKANVIVTDFTSTDAQRLDMAMDMSAAATPNADTYGAISLPRIQAQRVDRNGTKLQTAASYPNDYLTVAQIVEDVVGRFLVGAWYWPSNDSPMPGQVRPGDCFIDTSSTAQITNLTYYDGVTAAQVLDDLMTAQPDAYWAIWESAYGATDGLNGKSDWGFRFEWATWPASWGYQATSIDGLEEQPDGSAVYNYVHYIYGADFLIPYGLEQNVVWFDANNNQLLLDGRVTRAVTVRRDQPTSFATALAEAKAQVARLGRTVNTGTLTVRRPIHLYDAGADSWSGASRMLDPWLIRPGKLIRITDIPPRANSNTFNAGTSPFAPELDGTVFRVKSTTYSSSDNSCVLELDQVPAWDTATQIVKAGQGSSNLVVRG